MSTQYQEINRINISSDIKYSNFNSSIDTTGKINEKLAQNKFNYFVDIILMEEPSVENLI